MDLLPFLSAEECDATQLCVLTAIYGYILFTSANMIGDGSELLLLVPSLAGLVGSVVLPVLGAVPDGMMVLFSGIGPDAQNQVSVGVGALAGSTVMLLCIPWTLSVIGGRVVLDTAGRPRYQGQKLPPDTSLLATGVEVFSDIRKTSFLMLGTSLLYLLVQVPAFLLPKLDEHGKPLSVAEKADGVNKYSMFGIVGCALSFLVYLGYQYKLASASDDVYNQKRIEAIRSGTITLRGAMTGLLTKSSTIEQRGVSCSQLVEVGEADKAMMRDVLMPFYYFYDMNKDGTLERRELGMVMRDLNELLTEDEEKELFMRTDTNNSGDIDFDEFVEMMVRYVRGAEGRAPMKRSFVTPAHFDGPDGAEEEEEEEEVPEDLADLSPEEQQRRIIMRACSLMGLGTLLVLIFSDAAVDVLNEIGVRMDISPFYVSFVLAPLASNASELVAAYNYSCKKTRKSMTISLSTLLGAACMNNTFCLLIFMVLIYVKRLAWLFSAECCSILFIEWIMFFVAQKTVQTMKMAFMVLLLYPLSLVIVWSLENLCGWD